MPFSFEDSDVPDLLCTYAALILNDEGAPITADSIQKLITAAKGEVEPYYPKLFANMLEGKDINEILAGAKAASSSSSSSSSDSDSSSDSSSDSDSD